MKKAHVSSNAKPIGGSENHLGKEISELISPDTKILSDGSVVGTIHYVTDYVGFNESNPDEQEGYFFPVRLTGSGSKMTLKKDGVAKEEKTGMKYDPNLILRVDGQNTVWSIEVDGNEVVKLNFTKATFDSH